MSVKLDEYSWPQRKIRWSHNDFKADDKESGPHSHNESLPQKINTSKRLDTFDAGVMMQLFVK